jgi:DNA topoisomerase IB
MFLEFTGKKGVDLSIPVTDSELMAEIARRCVGAKPRDQLFSTSDSELRDYVSEITTGKYKPKDFRTMRGTQEAAKYVAAMQCCESEKEYKSKRKQIQEKLIKFATRIPAFMYLTDDRENTLKEVITKLEPELFKTVTGLTVSDFELLVGLNVFNSVHMDQAVFAFRRYEDSSLSYAGIETHQGLRSIGLYDTVVAKE